MTTFPALMPRAWDVVPGSYPATATTTLDGRTATMRHGTRESGRTWAAEFLVNFTQYNQVLTHYLDDQFGGIAPFQFSTTTLPAQFTPAGYEWKYTGAPSVEDRAQDYFILQITFECVPVEPTVAIQGGRARIRLRVAEAGLIPVINAPWADVQAFLPVNGADGSTVIADASQYGRTVVTVSGKISSAFKILGKNTITTTSATIASLCTIEGLYTTTLPSVFTLEGRFYLSGGGPSAEVLFRIGNNEATGRLGVFVDNSVIRLEQFGIGEWLVTDGLVSYNQSFHIAVIGKANNDVEVAINGISAGIAARPTSGIGNDGKIAVWGKKGSYANQIRYITTSTPYATPFILRQAPFSEA